MTSGWEASLRLGYVYNNGRTVLTQKQHTGPLVVQKALYPEGDAVCHTLIVHPPGGIAGGDRLAIDATLAADAKVLFTTPGATRWYRSTGTAASQGVTLQAKAGAVVEWLPQETIYFDHTIAQNSLDVQLEGNAVFIGWEIACLGRQRAGEAFEHGRVRQAMTIQVDGRTVFIERGQLNAQDALLASPLGFGGDKVFGTLMAHSSRCSVPLLERCRDVAIPDGMRAGLTLIGNTLIGRALGNSSEQTRAVFVEWWKIIREPLCGQVAVIPRIWRT
ncbi:MAG: urease accessory protein UreD [Betaproteobacteria bacterium]